MECRKYGLLYKNSRDLKTALANFCQEHITIISVYIHYT